MNDFKFITRVVMPCTREQFLKHLKKPLSVLGYDVDTYTTPSSNEDLHLVSSYGGIKNNIGLSQKKNLTFLNTMIPFNPELFLALAIMTDVKYGIAGEWWVFQEESDNSFTTNKLYIAQKSIDDWTAFIDNTGIGNGFHGTRSDGNIKKFRKATKEEIITHFENINTVKKVEEFDYNKGYVVRTTNKYETNIVSSHIKNMPTSYSRFNYVICIPGETGSTLFDEIPYNCKDYPILTFEEFKEKIYNSGNQINQIKTKEMEAEKKIIGRKVPCDMKYWDLKKDEIIKLDLGDYGFDDSFYKHKGKCIPSPIFESWEPVYKAESKVFKMGIDSINSFNLTVKEGKCFHKGEDISRFVIELTDFYNRIPSKFAGFNVGLSNITFYLTGCEHIETDLVQWVKVRSEMKKTNI